MTGPTVRPDSNPELNDKTLADEIRLLGDLVVAASRVTRHLTQAEVDQVLNLDPPVSESLAVTG
jgi:hypothetical protein